MNSITLRIVIIYALAGILWITISDVIFLTIEGEKDHPILVMGSISACLFLVATSYILYKLITIHFRRLENSEKQYRSYFEDNPTPMWIYDRKTLKFTSVNNAAIYNYGYSKDDFLKMTILDIRPEEDAEKLMEAVRPFETAYKNSGTWNHKRKDGTTIFAQITSHLTHLNGRQQVMVMAKDITKRVQTELQLMRANTELIKRNTVLSEIAWSESHNVRRPLASILGLINVIKSANGIDEVHECFKYIELSAYELDFMIKNINEQISDAVYVNPE